MGEAGALPLRSDTQGRYSSPWPERLVFTGCLVCAILLIPDAAVYLEGFLGNYSLIGSIVCASLVTPLIADLLIRIMYRAMRLRK
ncbi:MAG: hypothetical protein CMB22_03205 [Euryarchaeota archaeon]|nr:hypothetical protein [Euryarchaeota archaeon]|tara:strand:+ start:5372 stop:5626 length:255 start_codon:yes stop_codon:yes gene_type:complete